MVKFAEGRCYWLNLLRGGANSYICGSGCGGGGTGSYISRLGRLLNLPNFLAAKFIMAEQWDGRFRGHFASLAGVTEWPSGDV